MKLNYLVHSISSLSLFALLFACSNEPPADEPNWSDRAIVLRHSKNLSEGSTFLAVYDQISTNPSEKHELCATISIRNTNVKDSVYIQKGTLYNEHGKAIHDFFDETIFLRPMETLNLVLDSKLVNEKKGSNLIFDWSCSNNANEPFFEGVMISSSGHQGFSFVTRGKRLK